MRALVDRALQKSGDVKRYRRRMTSYPTLAKLGLLPQNFTDISNDESPWFCHGMAFRMATYSDACDYFFDRWEASIKLAQQAEGWEREYKNWDNTDDHWAKEWDKFYQFLWLIQCYEYFSRSGHNVSFPVSKKEARPDLLIMRQGLGKLYVECYFYTKWWLREEYIGELLSKIDKNLSIKRIFNIKRNASSNPFSLNDQFVKLLMGLETALAEERLVELRAAAQQLSPQKVCDIADFTIILKGKGETQAGENYHGDHRYSWPVYVREIIDAKKDENNLKVCRPNLLMVNGLSLDFQVSFPENVDQRPLFRERISSIDEIWISKCGIDETLVMCQQEDRVLKMIRDGYCGFELEVET
jgi:hypothetical protein